MPLIYYKCKKCEFLQSKLIKSSDLRGLETKQKCPNCGENDSFIRQLGAPASVGKLVIDTGNMAKAVEIVPDIIEMNQKDSKKDRTRE